MQCLSDLLLSEIPKYELTIPSSKKKVSFRPFLVKEEKVLLIAQQTGTYEDNIRAIKNVIESCVNDIDDIDSMPLFDVEYIFLQLRIKSIGSIVEPTIVCPETGESISIELDLTKIKATTNEKQTNKIKINDNVMITMKYPTIRTIENEEEIDYNDPEKFYDLVVNCIERIDTNEETIDVEMLPKKELEDFLDNMNKKQFENILEFFLTSPKLYHEVKYTTSDGVERELVLQGISDFLE